MTASKRDAASIADATSEEPTKRQRRQSKSIESDQSAEASSEDSLSRARGQVVDFGKLQYPAFTRGQDLGYFAIAAREEVDSTAHAACLHWLSRYFADEMRKVSYEDVEDYIGALVAAKLSVLGDDHNNRNRVKAIRFITYRAPDEVLRKGIGPVDSSLLSKADPKLAPTIAEAWRSCASLRENMCLTVQHIARNSANDGGLEVRRCETMWKEVRAAIREGLALRDITSAIGKLPPSTFKESFEKLRARMDNGEFTLAASVSEKCCVGSLTKFPGQVTDFQDFIDGCAAEKRDYEQGSRFKEAPEWLEDAVHNLQAADTLRRQNFMHQCNIDLLHDLAGKQDALLSGAY